MPIPTSTQTIDGVIDGLIAACSSIYGLTLDTGSGEYVGTWNDGTADREVVLVEGGPGSYMPDIIIAVASEVKQPISRPTMGLQRSREITAEVDVTISVAMAGNSSASAVARRSANAAADALALYFREIGNETLAGACREAWVSGLEGPTPSLAITAEGGVYGRVAQIVATVTASIRN